MVSVFFCASDIVVGNVQEAVAQIRSPLCRQTLFVRSESKK